MNRRADRPSAGVLLAGGFGVLVVLLFVGSMAAADLATTSLGPRVRLVQGPALLVARCQDERVASIQVGPLHEEFPGGTLDRRFALSLRSSVVNTTTELRIHVGLVGGTVLTATADPAKLPADPGGPSGTPPPCTHRRVSATTVLFGAAALVVVGGYGVMVVRSFRR